MSNKKTYLAITISFIAIEFILLMLILFAPNSAYSCYAAIVLVLIYSLLFKPENKKIILTQIALAFTLLSDTFLVGIFPTIQWLSMSSFFIVQSLYFARLLLNVQSKKYIYLNLALRIALIAISLLVGYLVLKDKFDYVSGISLAYFVSLIHNIVLACTMFKKSPMFAIGLILFILCDIVVGFNSAIGVYISVPETSIIYKIAFAPFNLAWTFYVPSQTLISLSIKDEK